ncbi:citrate lyase subunit alpha [Variovorax sp. J22R24]|uniref:citrate lyase subunit alpha n=1 Tax=Variovorax gracilis TaxID=3053502 RepID=UPI002574D06A|nr:citrate lyase subunit alpha [Variovorax sp. J22R24]MDM0109472.1 citrate lyase subunit alpha [Variovorax sp. J22R24]
MTDFHSRAVPPHIDGYGRTRPFIGIGLPPEIATRTSTRVCPAVRGRDKQLRNLEAAFDACRIKDGDTLSFHHHLRNGDQVLNQVLAVAAARGLRDLRIAASSLFPVHAPLVDHIRSGVVARICTAYMSGPVADAVSDGLLPTPVVMQTHGGRARAIEAGELQIDVAFVAAPSADRCGNLSGAEGRAACGPLGYAMVDAQYARRVVGVTDHIGEYPLVQIDITQEQVDFIVRVDSIGDPAGILSGSTRPTTDPIGLGIAETAANVIAASGLLVDGFSFQTGAGGISLAVSQFVQATMRKRNVQGSFGAGGVTGYLVDMLEEGLFRSLFDVQCFDLRAVESYRRDVRHQAMSASLYANPHNSGSIADQLDAMLLGAAEVDLGFNVNVTTGSSGRILGGSGGHADTAAGAKLALVATRLTSAGGTKIVESVRCVTTPGESIDAVVTEHGVAVNPARGDLRDRLVQNGLKVVDMGVLQSLATSLAPTPPRPVLTEQRIVGIMEYRDGRVIDVIRAATGTRAATR